MKKLIKQYSFNSDMQYFEMIVQSVINVQYSQAKEQFKTMPKNKRLLFIDLLQTKFTSSIENRVGIIQFFHTEQHKKEITFIL